MNKKTISLVLGLMCFALTLGIVIQIKTVNKTGTALSTNAKENELRDAVLKAKEKYDNLYNSNLKSGVIFKQKDREKGISCLIAVNLLKRMESSVHSFNETLKHIIDKITNLIDKNKLK